MAKTDLARSMENSPSRPGDVFAAMRNELDRVFERFEHGFPRWPSLFREGSGAIVTPELDVKENTDAVIVEAELPGVDEKDVSVTFANGMLTIKGEKKQSKEEKKEDYYLAERSYGAFERTLRLPESVDDAKIEAKFDKGVLRVKAAKKPEAIKAERKIEIKKA
jgi:HSP20 family protein